MSNKDKLYNLLVNRVPGIQERYKRNRRRASGVRKILVWIYLIGLNISYYVFRRKNLAVSEKFPYYEEKELYTKGSESSISGKRRPEELAGQLEEYDVISFDVFDTLVLRPFSEPADLFFFLGNKLNYPDFKRIRMEMEWMAREKKYKKSKSYEVDLEEIYTLLSHETGVDGQSTAAMEIELENQFCFANPYMERVVKLLRVKGKRMIVASDMYLNTGQIKALLKNCGYSDFDAYYVSCDLKESKNEGGLFDYIKTAEGSEKKYAHVGDNYISDVENSKKHGFAPFHYVNVNAVGETYRPYDMSSITGGIYRGLVNAHIHNGLNCYSREYEYGYIYGGLFVAGYCQFIHQYVKEHGIDKVLFLARDGHVLSKAYHILYPEEEGKWEYVYWSRLAALKLSARYYKYDYFRRFLYHKVNQGYTFRQIFASMELDGMLRGFCDDERCMADTTLTDKNIGKVKRYLMYHWETVLGHYEEQLAAGKKYYGRILDGCSHAAAVDIGWAGSGAIALDCVVNREWKMDCRITGIIAGTNSCHNAEPDTSETFLQSGRMVSYLYSQRENRDIWKLHDAGKGHNLYWEMLLDAPMGSFKGFYLDECGGCRCEFKQTKANTQIIEEVQRGVLDFVVHWQRISEKSGDFRTIGGRDAYAAMVNVENAVNRAFMERFEELADEANVG